jgi:hypothetical protein
MITKLYLCLIFLIFSAFSDACDVNLPNKLLIIEESSDLVSATIQKDCSAHEIKEIVNTVKSVEGKISSTQLSEILKSKNIKAKISPNLIEIQHLSHIIRKQIQLPSGISIKSSRAEESENFFSLSQGDLIDVQCSPCLFGERQPLNLTITEGNGSKKTIRIIAEFVKKVRAYKLRSSQHAFSKIDTSELEEVLVEAVPFTEFIDDLNVMKFYKFNKPVQAGELIRLSDLTAENLVRAGSKTEVVIENELIRLKTSAISRSNGTFGELVEVFHPQKNKKYNGKVIDLNKVLVEL